MGDSTTIAITKKVRKELLSFVHFLESQTNDRTSYSDAIAFLLKNVKEK
jgi:hypothetical protein